MKNSIFSILAVILITSCQHQRIGNDSGLQGKASITPKEFFKRGPASSRAGAELRAYLEKLPKKASVVQYGPDSEVVIFGKLGEDIVVKVCAQLSVIEAKPGMELSCPSVEGTAESRFSTADVKAFLKQHARFAIAAYFGASPENLKMWIDKTSKQPVFANLTEQEFNWGSREEIGLGSLKNLRQYSFEDVRTNGGRKIIPVATDGTMNALWEVMEEQLNTPKVDYISWATFDTRSFEGSLLFGMYRSLAQYGRVNPNFTLANSEIIKEKIENTYQAKNHETAEIQGWFYWTREREAEFVTTLDFQDSMMARAKVLTFPIKQQDCRDMFFGFTCGSHPAGGVFLSPLVAAKPVWSDLEVNSLIATIIANSLNITSGADQELVYLPFVNSLKIEAQTDISPHKAYNSSKLKSQFHIGDPKRDRFRVSVLAVPKGMEVKTIGELTSWIENAIKTGKVKATTKLVN